jgi:hypothetical protein
MLIMLISDLLFRIMIDYYVFWNALLTYNTTYYII